MGGFFDGVNRITENPLFLGGVNLLMGGGPQGMMQGMEMGNQMEARRKQRESLIPAMQGLNLNDAERAFYEANPQGAAELLQRIHAERFDPMSDVRRKTAEANLRQTEQENGMFPLRQQLLRAQIAQNQAQVEQGRNGKYGLQPIIGMGPDGNPIIMQLSPSGEAVQTKLPDGARLDFGLKSRQQAEGTATGKAAGEAQFNLPGAEYNAGKITSLIDSVLNDPYLDRMTGPIQGRLPNLSGQSNRVQGKLDQIQGKTFLQAYESLKGSGQITEIEGAKAEASLQRLQNTRVGTDDYIKALREFRQDVQDLLGLARRRAGGSAFQSAPQQQPAGNGGWSMQRID